VKSSDLVNALAGLCPKALATDLTSEFLQMAMDVAVGLTGRSSPGKFVETVVQVLEFIDTGHFENSPKVDAYLKNAENSAPNLQGDLRITLARVARSMYTLRNKRNIAHKGDVDPNSYDLRYLFGSAQWIMAELLRHATQKSMQDTGALIEMVQAPVDAIVERFPTKHLVLADVSTKEELLLVLHGVYPDSRTGAELIRDLDRKKPDTVRRSLRDLWKVKLIEGDGSTGYKLTQMGYRESVLILAGLRSP
jgi:hypothetical protein